MRRSTPIAERKLAVIDALRGAIPKDGGRPVKKHSSLLEQRESGKEANPVRGDSREVMSELVAQLRKQLDREMAAERGEDKDEPHGERPNLPPVQASVPGWYARL